MKILYDMSTGMVLENSHPDRKRTQADTRNINLLPEAALHEINNINCEEPRIPTELTIADLNAFLREMSNG